MIGTQIKCVRLIRVPISCAARVSACDRVRRGTHAITSDVDTVQTPNKRAWNVLHPRLPAELSRVIAGDHVLFTTIARVNSLFRV